MAKTNDNYFISDIDFAKEIILSGNVKKIYNIIGCDRYGNRFGGFDRYEYPAYALCVIELAAKYADGFVVDICNRTLKAQYEQLRSIPMTDKQRWCVAYAAKIITASQIEEYRAFKAEEEKAIDAELEALEAEYNEKF